VLKIPEEIERVKRERERMPEVIKQDPNSHKFGITDRTLQIVNEVKKKI